MRALASKSSKVLREIAERPIQHSLPKDSRYELGVVLLSLILYCIQLLSWNQIAGFSNWWVPDGVSLAKICLRYWGRSFQFGETMLGIGVVYAYSVVQLIGLVGFFAVNLLLLVLTVRLKPFNSTLTPVLLVFPYFLVALALPSKDILVLAAGLAVISLALRRRMIAAFVLASAVYFVRDGAAVIFSVFLICWMVIQYRPRLALLAAIGVTTSALIVGFVADYLLHDLLIYARNVPGSYQGASPISGLSAQVAVAVRLFANLTNLAFRPSLLDEDGGVAVLGIAYWMSGVGLLYSAVVASKYILRRDNLVEIAVAMMFFVSLAVVSVVPFVQPRYLLPAAAIVLLVRLRSGIDGGVIKGLAATAVAAGVAIFAYSVANVPMPPDAIVQTWSPFAIQPWQH